MTIQPIHILSLTILISTQMTAQTAVRLGNYLIDPIHKTVSQFAYFEEDDPITQTHSWGERCTVDSAIDFNATCLYVGDNLLEFKEHYTPRLPEIVFDSNGNIVDMNDAKFFSKYAWWRDFSPYYEKNGEYYYTVPTLVRRENGSYDRKLVLHKLQIEAGIDFAKLKHAGDNCFYDDQALYRIHESPAYQLRLVKVASGEDCVPVVKQNYCIYNRKVYGIYEKHQKAQLIGADLDVNHLAEVFGSLTDGKTLLTPNQPVRSDTMNINQWKQLSTDEKLSREGNCVYMSKFDSEYGENEPHGREPVFGPLFATQKGFIVPDREFDKFEYYNKVFVFNFAKNKYEELDADEFQLCAQGFYVYRGQPYYDHRPVTDTLDLPELKYIFSPPGGHKWLTDGKRLIDVDKRRITNAKSEYGSVSYHHITFGAVPLADAPNLRMVYRDLLLDGVNFYSAQGREIQVIPVKSLGVEVKIMD